MAIVKNTNYYQTNLLAQISSSTNQQLIRTVTEIIEYGQSLESNIPPAENRPQRPKPEGAQSTLFRGIVNGMANDISSELLDMLNEFLDYIELMENQISST